MKKLIILGAMLASGVVQAETVEERKARCEAQGEIVAQAVEMRLKRRGEAKTRKVIAQTAPEKMQGSVTPLVGYVFTLARSDVKNGKVAEAFVAQCSAFDPNG